MSRLQCTRKSRVRSTHQSIRNVKGDARISQSKNKRRHTDYTSPGIRQSMVMFGKTLDWPYSAFHRYVKNGLYPPDWGGDGMGVKDSTDFGK
ncbi:MAG: hypothetical protein L6Q53_05570 [Candidatus Brocadia sinica]|uniref:hypothetical protein n=1 Tax=Candidatus Brocadia TaxID=380240 RepID=UPI0006981732|nr:MULTISPECIES: hypothetical protein [Brocadia]MCK6467645.1 hypothetical protein [Candidatus Brocadia sinica]NUO06528.1 hypothetical protein [Candidatus Brocadia sinica]